MSHLLADAVAVQRIGEYPVKTATGHNGDNKTARAKTATRVRSKTQKTAKVDERRRKTADYVVILKNSSKLVNKIHT